MKECDVLELSQAMRAIPRAGRLIDVREFPEYAGGRVAGANLLPLGDLTKRYNEIDRDQTVYLICRTGRRSAEAQCQLEALGFADVRNVRGGFEAWKSAGLPIEKDAKAIWSMDRQVRFAAGTFVVMGIIMSLLVHPLFLALSAFVGAGLVFAAVTDSCGMTLLLAKLPWNQESGATCAAEITEA